jgi:phosphatidylglycerophosphatase A
MKRFAKIFNTLFGIGFIPYAPGTIASAFTVLSWYFFIQFFSTYSFMIFIFLITILSIYLVNLHLTDHLSDDPSEVVIDEFIGQSLPLIFLSQNSELFEIFFVFICFRIFDIYKIYPVNLGEKMKGAVGVIADDVIAGIYTIICLMIYRIILY